MAGGTGNGPLQSMQLTCHMKWTLPKPRSTRLYAFVTPMAETANMYSQDRKPTLPVSSTSGDNVAQFVNLLCWKAKALASSSGMRSGFQSFTSAHQLSPASVRYSDYVLVRLLFEATRDAEFWNLHWAVTDQPPTPIGFGNSGRASGSHLLLNQQLPQSAMNSRRSCGARGGQKCRIVVASAKSHRCCMGGASSDGPSCARGRANDAGLSGRKRFLRHTEVQSMAPEDDP